MLRHVVMWKLKDEAAGFGRQENARTMKHRLEALQGRIPNIKAIKVGINERDDPDAWYVVLIADFDDPDGLRAYLDHPLHREAGAFIGPVRLERKSVDYTVDG